MKPFDINILNEKCLKLGWARAIRTIDKDSGNSIVTIEWTDAGKTALLILAGYSSYGPMEPLECEALFVFASQMFPPKPSFPPRN